MLAAGITAVALALTATAVAAGQWTAAIPASAPAWAAAAAEELEQEMVASHGEGQRARIRRGLTQVAGFWRAEDGDREAFAAFVRTHFASDQTTLDALFERFDWVLEQLDGHHNAMTLALKRQADLDLGPIRPFDELFAAYDPSAHLSDDFFANKLAFVALLNLPVTTLEERLGNGATWSNRQWAEARLASRFAKRIPAEVRLELSRVDAAASQYIASYNIWAHHLVDDQGARVFPPGLRLLSHWNLRDEVKANYSEGATGLARQRTIARVMERIVDQSIPAVVVDNPHVDWNPFTNQVAAAAVRDSEQPPPAGMVVSSAAEPDTRYARLLASFHAARLVDPYSPTAPTQIERAFNEGRELPIERVEAMLEALLASPLLARVAALVESRVGRPLEPFDIWYAGFRPRGAFSEAELDAITRERYPNAAAYQADMPRMLTRLGFSEDRARQLAASIAVDAARGSGHAWGSAMRGQQSRLRTRVGAAGMDYKGYNIAVHEMGHNVEQTISTEDVEYHSLSGVPNTAFTEAVAFVFQNRDLELLGLTTADDTSRALQTLDDYWSGAEIAAVALVDVKVWQWMYDHPETTPVELKAAVLEIARTVWNTYYEPIVGQRDSTLLAVYSHMLSYPIYLPDYPVGALIQAQVEAHLAGKAAVGPEIERMCRIGRVAPDLWMERATGAAVGPEALLAATEKALALVDAGAGAGSHES